MARPPGGSTGPRTTAQNSLVRLQRQAAILGCSEVLYDRALGPTSERLDCTLDEAGVYILATVQTLKAEMFVQSVLLRDQRWYDEYACYREDGWSWYVKVGESEDGLVVVSHHDPERPALRIDGATIHPGRKSP